MPAGRRGIRRARLRRPRIDPGPMTRLPLARLLACALALLGLSAAADAGEGPVHGVAMYGEPALAPDFAHLPYADPAARRGGRITLGNQGTFDSLNPLIVIGVAPDLVPRYVLQS